MTGRLFVISAPSGCGKTTLSKKILKSGLGLVGSVSMTTRPPRKGEKDGKDYYFVTEKAFRDTVKKKGFLEYEENFGRLYGTPKKFVDRNLAEGTSVLLEIDVKGAMKVKKAYPGESVLIFILPPSIGELKKRLCSRRSEDARSLKERLALAKKEISYAGRYDHTVVNDRLDAAYRELKKVIVSSIKPKER